MIHDGKTSFLPGQPIAAAQWAEASGSLCVGAGLGGLNRAVGMMGRGAFDAAAAFYISHRLSFLP